MRMRIGYLTKFALGTHTRHVAKMDMDFHDARDWEKEVKDLNEVEKEEATKARKDLNCEDKVKEEWERERMEKITLMNSA